jgi:hypothetical protein
METSTDVDSLQKSREILHFNKTEEEFKAMMTDIPEGMLKLINCLQSRIIKEI